LAEESEVSMEIYNIKGQKVKTLTNEFLLIGKHERIWDGKDENKQSVSSGIYFCKLRSSKYSAYRKMILLK
jgi:flagellar hook assembly protein FlgD